MNVRLGSLAEDIKEPTSIELPDGTTIVLEPLERLNNGRRVGLKNFDPCTILLNNDLSAGIPEILKNLHEQTLLPPLHAGWAVRRKTNHFAAYDEVAKKFGVTLIQEEFLKPATFLIDTDSTVRMAYFGRRKDVFRNELLAALKLLQDGTPRSTMRASWI